MTPPVLRYTTAYHLSLPRSLSGYSNRYPGLSSGASSADRGNSRTSSVVSLQSSTSEHEALDYKKLYEKERDENERLRKKIKDLEGQVTEIQRENDTKVIAGAANGTSQLSERDRRAFQRRIAELEEESKAVEQLRSDNQRLKEENGALIRVISKLSK